MRARNITSPVRPAACRMRHSRTVIASFGWMDGALARSRCQTTPYHSLPHTHTRYRHNSTTRCRRCQRDQNFTCTQTTHTHNIFVNNYTLFNVQFSTESGVCHLGIGKVSRIEHQCMRLLVNYQYYMPSNFVRKEIRRVNPLREHHEPPAASTGDLTTRPAITNRND